MELSQSQKAHNATPQGQREMCDAGASNAVLMMLNAKIRAKGAVTWSDAELSAMLANGAPSLRDTLRADLLAEYNALYAPIV